MGGDAVHTTGASGRTIVTPPIPINPLVGTSANGSTQTVQQMNAGTTQPASLVTPTIASSVPQTSAYAPGLGNSLTGYTPPVVDAPIAADEALQHLGLKLDKEGNLQKINNWIDISPEDLRKGQQIQSLVKRGKMPLKGQSHTMRTLIGAYLGANQ
jgi:hypothetical protein